MSRPRRQPAKPFFVDLDYEIVSELDAGRYLVIPLPEREDE